MKILTSILNFNSIGVLSLIISLSIISCSPQSKESYLKQYNEFVTKIGNEYQTYSDKDWRNILREHNKFTGDWYNKFKNELTIKDHIILTKNEVQFNIFKMKYNAKVITGYDFTKDYEKLKGQIKYYSENEMRDDLEFLIEQAEEVGGELEKSINDILKELDIEINDLKQ